MRSVLNLGLILALTLTVISCAKPPTQEMDAAQAAIDAAKAAEAASASSTAAASTSLPRSVNGAAAGCGAQGATDSRVKIDIITPPYGNRFTASLFPPIPPPIPRQQGSISSGTALWFTLFLIQTLGWDIGNHRVAGCV